MSKVTDETDAMLDNASQPDAGGSPAREPKVNDSSAYMNRLFCSTRERLTYIIKSSCGNLKLGKYDVDSDLYLYTIYGIDPKQYASKFKWLGLYDIINDPMSALIIDNMRTRWGKFKPFQYLSLLPSLVTGVFTCFLPLIALNGGYDSTKKLWVFLALQFIGETVGAFFGGGGYIDNVFTPNPNERTSLLVASKFVADLFSKFPEQLAGIIIDLVDNGKLDLNIIKAYVIMKFFWWIVATVPGIFWTVVSKERVPQSEKPPNPWKSIASVFRNKPLLIHTLSGVLGGISIGTSESLYYREVLKFTMLPTFGGIPGMPISYASYAFVPKFRKRFSTKALWLMQRCAVSTSEILFFLVGILGGKTNGLYRKKAPMLIAFGLGNCLEMVFYATGKIIGDEINYEVLDYCEWKNGYRVEATVNLLKGYFSKLQNIILKIVNANLLVDWAGFDIDSTMAQTDETQWRMFLTACGPKLIFGLLGMIPMFFYNIDNKTREQMYLDLEKMRSEAAAREKRLSDEDEQAAAVINKSISES